MLTFKSGEVGMPTKDVIRNMIGVHAFLPVADIGVFWGFLGTPSVWKKMGNYGFGELVEIVQINQK